MCGVYWVTAVRRTIRQHGHGQAAGDLGADPLCSGRVVGGRGLVVDHIGED